MTLICLAEAVEIFHLEEEDNMKLVLLTVLSFGVWATSTMAADPICVDGKCSISTTAAPLQSPSTSPPVSNTAKTIKLLFPRARFFAHDLVKSVGPKSVASRAKSFRKCSCK